MSDMNVNQVLAQMRALAARSGVQGPAGTESAAEGGTAKADFGNLLKDSLGKVNDLQMTSGHMATAFEKGDPNVSLVDVMIAKEKAGIAFQAMLQVRNKLVSAYEEVMRMQV